MPSCAIGTCMALLCRILPHRLHVSNQPVDCSLQNSWHCIIEVWGTFSLRWRYNGRDSVSNHQPHDCLHNRLFRRRSKKTSKLRVIGLWAVNSPGTGEFPAKKARNVENVSIWWRHHDNRNSNSKDKIRFLSSGDTATATRCLHWILVYSEHCSDFAILMTVVVLFVYEKSVQIVTDKCLWAIFTSIYTDAYVDVYFVYVYMVIH